jgi:hypothetical protein
MGKAILPRSAGFPDPRITELDVPESTDNVEGIVGRPYAFIEEL